MGDVVDINTNLPHRVSEVICVRCGARWICLRPVGTLLKDIECKNCGPGGVIETGEDMTPETPSRTGGTWNGLE